MCCANCCNAKNNASFRGSLIRFLKFVLEACPHWQLGYELPSPSAARTLGYSTSRIWRIASDSDKQPDWISQLDSCAWITSKITYAQACLTLRRMTHFVCQFHTSDCSMCMAEVIWRRTSFVLFMEFGETSLFWTGLILQMIHQNTTCHPESIAYSSLQYLV